MAVTYKLEKITPTKARKLLKNNLKNRKPKQAVIDRLCKDMKAGKWQENGQTIVISKNETLVDGQHRLFACIDADTDFKTLVVRGVEEEVIHTIDTGAARTLGNLFEIEGMNYSVDRASLTNHLMAFLGHTSHKDHGFNLNVPNATKFEVYTQFHGQLDEAIRYRNKLSSHLGFYRKSDWSFAYFLLVRKYNVSKVNEFWDKAINGGDYAYSPSNALMQFTASRRNGMEYRHRREDFFAILTAFTAWINNEECRKLYAKEIIKHSPEWYVDFPIKSKVLTKAALEAEFLDIEDAA